VIFLDVRNFTQNARGRPPEAVFEFLNSNFAFMIEAIDRHRGFINNPRRVDWIKSVAGLRQTKLRGPAKIDWA
jgi:class 3 adenylate cyclase